MKEASPLYRKLSEDEKAGYVKLAEGTGSLPLTTPRGAFDIWLLSPCTAASWPLQRLDASQFNIPITPKMLSITNSSTICDYCAGSRACSSCASVHSTRQVAMRSSCDCCHWQALRLLGCTILGSHRDLSNHAVHWTRHAMSKTCRRIQRRSAGYREGLAEDCSAASHKLFHSLLVATAASKAHVRHCTPAEDKTQHEKRLRENPWAQRRLEKDCGGLQCCLS